MYKDKYKNEEVFHLKVRSHDETVLVNKQHSAIQLAIYEYVRGKPIKEIPLFA